MQIIADLEVHSKYARAVSPQMTPENISLWAGKKGIGLVGTGDFTHPMWLRELEANLEEAGDGVFRLRKSKETPLFLLTSEVSCIYSHRGKGRRVHILVYLPNFASVKKFNSELTARGANLFSDGRPIIGLTLSQVAEIALNVEPKAIIIPAHVWTPWFGFYGHLGGYDSLEEAFGEMAKSIYAIETGLSSDPAMNWRIEELENRNIVSFGDAHSPQKLGREATIFEISGQSSELSYELVREAVTGLSSNNKPLRAKIAYTIEFYPEEGKYHYTGHRKCGVVYSPNEARKMGITCPVCGKQLTFGVMSRVESLASYDVETESVTDEFGVRWIKPASDAKGPRPGRRPYVMLVPLMEIIAEVLKVGVGTQQVSIVYDQLINAFDSEFSVLLTTSVEAMQKVADSRIVEGIKKVRSGNIVIEPGYDGIFGKVKIWREEEKEKNAIDQATLF